MALVNSTATIKDSGDPTPDARGGVSSGPFTVALPSGTGISTGVSVDCVPHALRYAPMDGTSDVDRKNSSEST